MIKNPLILGAKGMLGGQLMKLFGSPTGWDRKDVDVLQFQDVRTKIARLANKPEAIINCVAFNDVDGAEEKPDIANALNVDFVGNLAALAKELAVPLVHFSSNYVFDGEKGEYGEGDLPHPLSVYGQSKYRGEQAVRQAAGNYYLIRTAVLFGPKGESELSKKSFVELMLGLAEKNTSIPAVADEINSLTYVADLAQTVKGLLDAKMPYGLYHVTNAGQASWYDYAKEIFSILKKEIAVIPVPSTEFPRKAPRPKKSVLINTKLPQLRPWQEALREYLAKGL